MQSEWRNVLLEDVAAEITVGYVGSMSSEYIDDGVPFLRSKNIEPLRINTDDIKYISQAFHQKVSKSRLTPGDVVIVRTGKPGSCAVIPDWLEDANCSDLVIVRCGKEINNRFLAYYINTAATGHISAHLVGAVQQHFNVASARVLNIKLPTLKEQEEIVNILGSLDDKIELNRQMNATLEAMAQALFKSWFVDFDPVIDNALAAGNPIPDELEAKAAARQALGDARKPLPEDIRSLFPNTFVFTEEMGWIPEGWEIRSLESLITLIGGGTPKTSTEAYWNGDIPWFSVVDAPNPSDVFVIETEKHITRFGVEKSSTKILPIGTTIISARGTVGKCAMVATPMAMNQSCYGIRGIDGISDTFIYYSIYLQVTDLQQKSHGSIFSTITRDTFKSIQMPFSNVPLCTRQFS
ncbi:MAG: restriction endonuclease subunit S [Thiothrix sp.]|uniref:restriction endonuclease subunit S n=1 Tax=Thiothrix sp. TaxID=1032 RepID=UPI00261424BB|nr:restriction endonuclease subunit S [Thiothrix sp.]MDD5395608.1 restriction endonuclease subunit S [Thiothrix sp.]